MWKRCFGFLFLTCVGAIAADVTPLDVKLGEWETTMTSQGLGPAIGAGIRPEVLAQMPPEQRAKMEAALKQANQPRPTVTRRCVSKDELSKALLLGNSQASCKATLVNSTSTKQEAHVECAEKGMTSTGTILVEAQNSETIRLDIQVTALVNGQPTKVSTSGTSKWISATCTDKK
jgi:hypothetical protein